MRLGQLISTSILVVHLVYMLLHKLEGREEDGIYDTRTAHGDAEAAIHVALEEFDFRGGFNLFTFRIE
jgi:hypothetical protein